MVNTPEIKWPHVGHLLIIIGNVVLKPTDIRDPEYFHKVVDCQYACPAHTPVPEYIRLIAAGRYTDAYMVNWESNVFPGVLGRTCDRPCEPACRRGRVEEEPVAICRLKRVAADNKDDGDFDDEDEEDDDDEQSRGKTSEGGLIMALVNMQLQQRFNSFLPRFSHQFSNE